MEDSKDSGAAASEPTSTPRRVKAPPKTTPPEAKEGDTSVGGDVKGDAPAPVKKKKALPPPANPPPQGGASAAAAFRSKSSLPPPNGPPPTGAAPSASVAKIRGAARPPSSGPPPNGAQSKPMGPPPSNPPPKLAASNSGLGSESKDESKSSATISEQAKAPERKVSQPLVNEKPDAKRATPSIDQEKRPATSEAKIVRSAPPKTAPAKAAPVDLLGESSPIVAPANSFRPAPTIADHGAHPVKSAPITIQPPAQRPQTVSDMAPPSATKTPVVKKSTIDVLNDTSASISAHNRNTEDNDAKRTQATDAKPKSGRSVPFSGLTRPNVPEDETIIVKKQEVEQPQANNESNGKDPAQATTKNQPLNRHQFDDGLDDVEEIPFLDDSSTEAKSSTKEAKKTSVEANDDDPVIVIESKRAPAKGSSNRFSADAQDHKGYSNQNIGAKQEDLDHLDSDNESPVAPATQEDIYNDLRRLKQASSRNDEEIETSRASSASHSGKRDSESNEDDAKEASSSSIEHSHRREKSREKRKERKRSKPEEEVKKIQAQFFNPKSVPYVPDHLLEFVKRPLECGRGHIVKCFIERNDSGPNKLAPIYTLLLEVNSSSGRPIMYARRKASSRITSHFVISLNKEDLFLSRIMRSHQYIGKLRSSTSMMEYCLYDQGDNPEDLDSDCEIDDEVRKCIRAELAVVRYQNSKKPYARKMEVVIPAIGEGDCGYLEWRPISRDQMIEEHARVITAAGGQNVLNTSNFIFMHKRETKYDPLSSCIVDFRSRATCVSVKNFQLVHSEPTNEPMVEKYRKLHPDYVFEDQGTVSLPQEHVLLQLGKVGKDCFNMDFQYPLSMLQAFAISLSRFDTKQR